MNEKIAKKVGEAYAFSYVLKDLYHKTPDTLDVILGSHSASLVSTVEDQMKGLEEVSSFFSMKEIVLPKAERTKLKILHMGDFYVGDDWDDEAEVLEWLSFFLGGALIHWQLVYGAAREIGDKDFIKVTKDGVDYFSSLLKKAKESAEAVGVARTKEE